jgi:hypothetical protein
VTTTSQPDPIRAEALGLDTATAFFAGRDWRIPLDVDTWPLDLIRHCRGVTAERRILIDHLAVVEALQALLGDQWDEFTDAAPRRGDLVPASQAFAAAAGLRAGADTDADNQPIDRVFGALPRLLAVLAHWPEAVESDLNRFWGLDYRDRWRFDADGSRKLTMRQIHTRITHLPADSALAVEMGRRSPTELLLMDLYEPLAGRPHPARPLSAQQIAERRAEAEKLAKARSDYENRRSARGDRVSTGLDTARENAQRTRGTS